MRGMKLRESRQNRPSAPSRGVRSESGSAILAALFILLLLGAAGIVLLFQSQTELVMNRGSHRAKQVFYLAESGIEHGRTQLRLDIGLDEFDPALDDAFGVDDTLNFDPAALVVQYDSDGVPTGMTGYGDDEPLVDLTPLAGGWYAAFLTNDPAEGIDNADDENQLVMITSIGVDDDGSFEMTQAIVIKEELLPGLPPATITLLGPDPVFDGGTADVHEYSGDDCGGLGDPSIAVPVVGTVSTEAELVAEQGIHYDETTDEGPDYESGAWVREDTFADLTDLSEPTVDEMLASMWTDCGAVHDLVEELRQLADVVCCTAPVCDPPVPSTCTLPATSISNLIFIDGDWVVGPEGGAGTLVVTGEVTYDGRASWNGTIFIFGAGEFERNGGGNGDISGAIMVGDIAGPDGVYGNTDDCTGGDGGFAPVDYEMNGGGNADTLYCSTDYLASRPIPPYDIVAFRQF